MGISGVERVIEAFLLIMVVLMLAGCDGLDKKNSQGRDDTYERGEDDPANDEEADADVERDGEMDADSLDPDTIEPIPDNEERESDDIDDIEIKGCTDTGWILQTNFFGPDPGDTGVDLLDVWGLDENNIWAVGKNGMLIFYNGQEWEIRELPGGEGNLRSVWAFDVNNVWAAGEDGRVIFWDGMSWTVQDSKATKDLKTIWGSDKSNVWAASRDEIVFWDGNEWNLTEMNGYSLEKVWGVDGSHVWALAFGEILFYDGINWGAQYEKENRYFSTIGGMGTGSIWVTWDVYYDIYACEQSFVMHGDGHVWSESQGLHSGGGGCIKDIFATEEGYVWAVGARPTGYEGGAIYFWEDGGEGASNCVTRGGMNGVWGIDKYRIWAVGEDLDVMFYGNE